MDVDLTPDLAAYAAATVSAGLYASPSDVVREGLRLPMERDREVKGPAQPAPQRGRRGMEQARRGELISGDEAFGKFRP